MIDTFGYWMKVGKVNINCRLKVKIDKQNSGD